MKSMIKVLGVIVFVVLIGFPVMAGGKSDSGSASTAPAATIGSITITDIPAQYNGKFAMLTLDTGGSGASNVAWATRTITGTSATFNLLDWVTDQPTAIREGNYGVNIVIAANMQAIADDQHEYVGIIMSRALAGESITVEFGELMSF